MIFKQYIYKILIGVGGILLLSPSFAINYIPSGASGYLGYYPVNSVKIAISDKGVSSIVPYYNSMGFSSIMGRCSTFANINSEQAGAIESVPYQSDVYGFKFYNSSKPDSSGYILAAPDALFDTRYLSWHSGGQTIYGTAVFRNSKLSGSVPDNTYLSGPLCINTYYPELQGRSSMTITGLHLYAVGNIEPGKYFMKKSIYGIGHGATRWDPAKDSSEKINFSSSDAIEVLQTCDITPTTSTNIMFSNQLTKTYPTATLLESSPAGIIFNCNQNGVSGIFLRPRNPLVTTSNTGMSLTPGKSTTTISPYIVTSRDTTARNNALCNDNAAGALKYFNKNDLNAVTMNTQNLLTYYFNLCAKGEIKADIYTGSMDVQIMVQ